MTVYKLITKHGHPNAKANGQIYEHTWVMSELLGRPLTALEVVHHVDENRGNNKPSNLLLFATQAEHLMHHAKERAFKACGNSEFMKCSFCGNYDNPSNMLIRKDKYTAHHSACRTAKRSTPEGKAKEQAYLAKSRAKRKLSQQSI